MTVDLPQQGKVTSMHAAWYVCATVAGIVLIGAVPIYYSHYTQLIHSDPYGLGRFNVLLQVLVGLSDLANSFISFSLAVLLFWRKPNDRTALFTSSVFLIGAVAWTDALDYFLMAYVGVPSTRDLYLPLQVPWMILLFCIFPNGRFVPRWTRWLFPVSILISLLFLAIAEWRSVLLFTVFPQFVLVMYAQVYRYRRVSSEAERQQTKWVVLGLLLTIVLAVITSLIYKKPSGPLINLIPPMLAIAILRSRLWDIDIIINRTLVYGALTASVVGLYVLLVGWSSIGLQTQNNLAGSVFAILVIAFLFQPLRQRLQRMADRFVPLPQTASRVEQHKHQIAIRESQGTADTMLRGRWLLIARLAWVIVLITLTIMYAFSFVEVREALSTVCDEELCTLMRQIQHMDAGEQIKSSTGPPVGFADRLRPDQVKALETLGLTLDQYGWLGALQMGIPALVFLLIAAGLFWQKSDNWMALFVSVTVATTPLWATPLGFTLAVRQPAWEWVVGLAGFVSSHTTQIFWLIFPTGRFVPRWTRWTLLFFLVSSVFVSFYRPFVEHPRAPEFVAAFVLIYSSIGLYAQVYRYFRVASPLERQQLKWSVVGFAGFLCTALLVVLPLNELLISQAGSMDPARALILSAILDTLFHATTFFIPVAIVIAVLRYRLWEVDIIINRTLVYGALTGIIVIAFVILVGFLSILFQSSGNSIIAILATGLVALLFNPLRQRLQRGVNHLMFGERDDPYIALSRLGQRLEAAYAPESVLPTIVETVAQTLKLPYVGIALNQDGDFKIAAEFGRSKSEPINLPLIYQGEPVGELILAPRAPGEHFTSSERQLLDDLARQAGVAAHAVHLTADLQRSRERLVLAREEERRRLRRDLHDDLAPTLASLGLTASTVTDLISTNPTTATKLVKELQVEIRATVGNIRRLVYDLRPPTLDELGLLAAVHERAGQYSNAPAGFHVTVEAPAELPTLPAAVEVAAYRIVQEALENVSKHSQARTCSIRFANYNGLEIEITDDGIGLPPNITPGVGLRSMRERAEELGGTCMIERGKNGGTRVLACLPIGEFDGALARPHRG